MKIGELLELTLTKKLADIAKEDLTISEKPTRQALKDAGCYSISGKRGWFFEGDERILEQSIYDFVEPSKRGLNRARKEVSATIEKAEATTNPRSQLPNKTYSKQTNKQAGNPPNKLKKVTYEIEEQLHDELKIKSIREKRTVSEIVNEIIKKALK